MTNDDATANALALIALCKELFTTNITGTDVDDVIAFEVRGRDFGQQPGWAGVHLSFSVSWHTLGKTGKDARDALDVLLPNQSDATAAD
ncbi:MAG: hypothetical protein OXG82_08200 [Gammaproteobacteria bacterium]|nr:hypothetical protein [Gammaproteobacteria bacterium]